MEAFPLPVLGPSGITGGSLVSAPSKCLTCDRPCAQIRGDQLEACRYGYGVQRIDAEHLLVGLVVRSFNPSNATKKVGRNASDDQRLTRGQVQRAAASLRNSLAEVEAERAARRNEQLEAVGLEADFEDLLDRVKSDLDGVAGQLHDYRSLALQIRQNIESFLDIESEEPAHLRPILDRAAHQIAATYWASRMMESKLEGVRLLTDPSIITMSPTASSRLHGLVHKYRQIYHHACQDKGVDLYLAGESWGQIRGPVLAMEQIPLVMIDNAYKYAPTGSAITCTLRETEQEIELSVTSQGPKLEQHERNRIFQPGYRAEAAKRRETGLGLGLALLRVCCEILNADWEVRQSASGDSSDSYETTFIVTFERSK